MFHSRESIAQSTVEPGGAPSVVASELDYKKKDYSYPTYKLTKVLPQSGGQSVTITPNGTAETVFELPNKVFNLSRSILRYNSTESAAGVGNFNWIPADCWAHIRQIQLYTKTGTYFVDLMDVGVYTSITWKPETKLEDFLTYDKGTYSAAGTAAGTNTGSQLLRPCNRVAAENYRSNANGSVGQVDYLEPLYNFVGTANTADPVLEVRMPLGMIPNTFLSLDKDIVFNDIINLKIVWQQGTRVAWYGNSGTDPTGGGASVAEDANFNLQNITLYLAVEVDPLVEKNVREMFQRGYKIYSPYVFYNKTNLDGTSQNVSLRFDRSHGQRLMKIYHSLFNNTESDHTMYDHNNLADNKVAEFYTQLNSQRQQEFNLDTSAYDDYMLLKDKLKGSLILSANVYAYNWFWLEDFSDQIAPSEKPLSSADGPDQNLKRGLDLTSDVKWDFIGVTTANANHNHYSYAVVQRELSISPEGAVWI